MGFDRIEHKEKATRAGRAMVFGDNGTFKNNASMFADQGEKLIQTIVILSKRDG